MYKKYTFKVYPKENAREIYRVIEMAGTKTLDDLCMAILDAYDFIHEHLYEFCMDNKPYNSDECYQYLTEDDETETNVKIDKIKLQKGQNFLLLYDYGDDYDEDFDEDYNEKVDSRSREEPLSETKKRLYDLAFLYREKWLWKKL